MKEEEIAKGYEKIAFGGVGDAVRLLFCGEELPQLEGMDLFLISEIKRPKGGGLEIKFFDRLRALQCLESMLRTGKNPSGIYEALAAGASSLKESEEGEEEDRENEEFLP